MRLTACLLTAACATVLVACGGTAPTPAAPATDATPASAAPSAAPVAPSGAAATPDMGDVGLRALRRLYGADARLDGPWTGVPVDAAVRLPNEAAGAVTREVCARGPGASARETLLAVCGRMADFGHVTPGVVDLLVVGNDAVPNAVGLSLRDIGSMGDPGDVTYHRFGATLGGFEVDSGFTNMGETSGTRRIFLPRNGRFEEAAWMRSAIERGTGCTGTACDTAMDVEFTLRIDTLDPAAAVYPLQVSEDGRECGQPVARRHTLPFDAGTFRYVVPERLKRDGCSGAAR